MMMNYTPACSSYKIVPKHIFYSLAFSEWWYKRYYMDKANDAALSVNGEVVYLDSSINWSSVSGARKGQSPLLISKLILLEQRTVEEAAKRNAIPVKWLMQVVIKVSCSYMRSWDEDNGPRSNSKLWSCRKITYQCHAPRGRRSN